MPRGKRGFNDYEILGDVTNIIIRRKNGDIYKAQIDTEDLQKLIDLNYNWMIDINRRRDNIHVICKRYICCKDDKPVYYTKGLHQLLVDYNPEQGEKVDHKDGNGLNNCKDNLRITSNKGNLTNRKGPNRNNKSGYRNVSWNKDKEQWVVQLSINGKNTILGFFDDVHEAGKYAQKMREKYYSKIIMEETVKEVINQ